MSKTLEETYEMLDIEESLIDLTELNNNPEEAPTYIRNAMKNGLRKLRIPLDLLNVHHEDAFKEFESDSLEEIDEIDEKQRIQKKNYMFSPQISPTRTHHDKLIYPSYFAISYSNKAKALRFFSILDSEKFTEEPISSEEFKRKMDSYLGFLDSQVMISIRNAYSDFLSVQGKKIKKYELYVFSKRNISSVDRTEEAINSLINAYKVQNQPFEKSVQVVIKDLTDFKEMFECLEQEKQEKRFTLSQPVKFKFMKFENMSCSLNLLRVKDVYDAYEKYKSSLLIGNVRSFLGVTNKVNKVILNELKANPENFHVFNNGLTIIVNQLLKNERGEVTQLVNPRIVNGGQTSSSIYFGLKELPENERKHILEHAFVKVKIIEITDEDDINLIQEVAIAANTQTATKETDIFSSNPILKQLEEESKFLDIPGHTGKFFFERIQGSYKLACDMKADFKVKYPFSIDSGSIVQLLWIYLYLPNYASLGKQYSVKKLNELYKKIKIEIDQELYQDLLAIHILLIKLVDLVFSNKKETRLKPYNASYQGIRYYLCVILLLGNLINLKEIWEKQSDQDYFEKLFNQIDVVGIIIVLIEFIETIKDKNQTINDVLRKDHIAILILQKYMKDKIIPNSERSDMLKSFIGINDKINSDNDDEEDDDDDDDGEGIEGIEDIEEEEEDYTK